MMHMCVSLVGNGLNAAYGLTSFLLRPGLIAERSEAIISENGGLMLS